MKLERDNSLSCSLELTTLVIPGEIFFVLRIKFASHPASHVHTFTDSLTLLCFRHPPLFICSSSLFSVFYISARLSFSSHNFTHPVFLFKPFSFYSPSPLFLSLTFFTNSLLYISPELDTENSFLALSALSICHLAELID